MRALPGRREVLQGAALAGFALAARANAAVRSVDVQGHRGAPGLLPENTLPSFARALELGVDTLELDVVMTRDAEVVISHDPDLNPDITRGPDGSFLNARGPRIVDLSFAELQRYQVGRLRAGSRYAARYPEQQAIEDLRIPRLADLFEMVERSTRPMVRYAIETKLFPLRPDLTPPPEVVVDALLAQIDRFRLNRRVQILSFDWRSLALVQRKAPGMPTVYLTASFPNFDNLGAGADSPWTAGWQLRNFPSVAHMIRAAGGTHWSCAYQNLNAAKIEMAHRVGLQVLAWTVDDTATMEQLLDMQVDGLVTNRPDRAMALLRARGQRAGLRLQQELHATGVHHRPVRPGLAAGCRTT